MANFFKNNFVVGVTSGLVAALIAPVLFPALKRSSRPVAKGLIKGGMLLYEKGREVSAHAGELVEDVMAEIHAEQAQQHLDFPDDGQQDGEAASTTQEAGRSLRTVAKDGAVEPSTQPGRTS